MHGLLFETIKKKNLYEGKSAFQISFISNLSYYIRGPHSAAFVLHAQHGAFRLTLFQSQIDLIKGTAFPQTSKRTV